MQFVPFSEFKHDPRLLAKETLEEVPRQFLDYMNRNNILPMQTYEEQKAAIKRALSNKKSINSNGPQGKEADQYFAGLEEAFINKATEMGYDYTDVKDFIEDRGLPDNEIGILIAGMNKPHQYKNALFKGGAANQMQYEYNDPNMN